MNGKALRTWYKERCDDERQKVHVKCACNYSMLLYIKSTSAVKYSQAFFLCFVFVAWVVSKSLVLLLVLFYAMSIGLCFKVTLLFLAETKSSCTRPIHYSTVYSLCYHECIMWCVYSSQITGRSAYYMCSFTLHSNHDPHSCVCLYISFTLPGVWILYLC